MSDGEPPEWPGDVPEWTRRPRKIDGFKAVERWFEQHSEDEWHKVEAALMSIVDWTWEEKYTHLDDLSHVNGVVLIIEDGLVLVWHPLRDYPNYFRVVYVGHPDDEHR